MLTKREFRADDWAWTDYCEPRLPPTGPFFPANDKYVKCVRSSLYVVIRALLETCLFQKLCSPLLRFSIFCSLYSVLVPSFCPHRSHTVFSLNLELGSISSLRNSFLLDNFFSILSSVLSLCRIFTCWNYFINFRQLRTWAEISFFREFHAPLNRQLIILKLENSCASSNRSRSFFSENTTVPISVTGCTDPRIQLSPSILDFVDFTTIDNASNYRTCHTRFEYSFWNLWII